MGLLDHFGKKIDGADEAELQAMVDEFNHALAQKRAFHRLTLTRADGVKVEFPGLESKNKLTKVLGFVCDVSYGGLFFEPAYPPDLDHFELFSKHRMRLLLEGEVHSMLVIVANRREGGAGVQYQDAELHSKKAIAKFLYSRVGPRIVQEIKRLGGG